MTSIYPVGPVEPVEEGDEFEWLDNITCRNGKILRTGTRARVVAKTDSAPHGEMMGRGYNLLVDTGGELTVWATFEQCISRGLLRKVSSGIPRPTAWERIGGDDPL